MLYTGIVSKNNDKFKNTFEKKQTICEIREINVQIVHYNDCGRKRTEKKNLLMLRYQKHAETRAKLHTRKLQLQHKGQRMYCVM